MNHRSLNFQFYEEKEGKKEGEKDGEEINKMKRHDQPNLCRTEHSGPETAVPQKACLQGWPLARTWELRFWKIFIIFLFKKTLFYLNWELMRFILDDVCLLGVWNFGSCSVEGACVTSP